MTHCLSFNARIFGLGTVTNANIHVRSLYRRNIHTCGV